MRDTLGDDILNSLLTYPITDLKEQPRLSSELQPTSQNEPAESAAALTCTSSTKLLFQPHPSSPVPLPAPPPHMATTSLNEPLLSVEPCPATRFAAPMTEGELNVVINGRIPQNTKHVTNWGMSVWTEWCEERNIKTPIEHMPDKDIDNNMAHFVQEARRKDCKEYPASSLHNIVTGIQRFLREDGRPGVSFLTKRARVRPTEEVFGCENEKPH